jgi:hypothetical protein
MAYIAILFSWLIIADQNIARKVDKTKIYCEIHNQEIYRQVPDKYFPVNICENPHKYYKYL